jgi:hypothetical protein
MAELMPWNVTHTKNQNQKIQDIKSAKWQTASYKRIKTTATHATQLPFYLHGIII